MKQAGTGVAEVKILSI